MSIHACCFLRTREAQVVQKCRLHESSLQSQMALQRVRPWPARLLRRRPRVPIVSHAASETLSNSPWWKFCLVLQTVCCLSPHHHLHWCLAEIFGMSCWFFPLLLKLSWPLVSSLLYCSFLLFLCPSLDFSCVGGFCHLFCSGWLRMKKCQWSLCMELLREIKERGYDNQNLCASVSYIWLPLSVCRVETCLLNEWLAVYLPGMCRLKYLYYDNSLAFYGIFFFYVVF